MVIFVACVVMGWAWRSSRAGSTCASGRPPAGSVAVAHGPDAKRTTKLAPEAGGYFAGVVRELRAGDRYRFRLDDDPKIYPDPASRFQPDGPHGPSEVVDPRAFRLDATATGAASAARGQVIYELHVGTFTREGTYAAAARELPALARARRSPSSR